MRNTFSTLAIAIALLLPHNAAQADGFAGSISVAASPAAVLDIQPASPAPAAPKVSAPELEPSLAWILALGFLGAIVLRRTRDD